MYLQVREVGDGNINYVYIVEGPSGAVVLKQGLPYIRIAHGLASHTGMHEGALPHDFFAGDPFPGM